MIEILGIVAASVLVLCLLNLGSKLHRKREREKDA